LPGGFFPAELWMGNRRASSRRAATAFRTGPTVTMFTVFQVISLALGFWTWNLIGQGVLFVLAGSKREQNAIYRLLRALNVPMVWAARQVTLGFIPEVNLGFVALFLVLLARVVTYSLFYSQGWIPPIETPDSAAN
jgi:hypothetical protein